MNFNDSTNVGNSRVAGMPFSCGASASPSIPIHLLNRLNCPEFLAAALARSELVALGLGTSREVLKDFV